jgi:UDP-galactopyranose mutase
MDLLCFSHLRWDFVFQRPNHLMARAARTFRVHYVEEPIVEDGPPHLTFEERDGVIRVIPHIPPSDSATAVASLRRLVDGLITDRRIRRPVVWYYTPMAVPWTRHLAADAAVTVYDCMDDLAGFKDAPRGLRALERELLEQADLVFTGGASLHQEKSRSRDAVHCFPSSVDVAHFATARQRPPEPADQAVIPGPRIGYFGVLDERIDWPLLAEVAARRPDLQFVLVGPTAKVDPASLPQAPNLHYLGGKPYADLPRYLAGWDVAMMPFARNDATRFISPTKTPEYLAGGRPVATTSVRDVVSPYGEIGLVHVGDTPRQFLDAIERGLREDVTDLRARADAFLGGRSWDDTWRRMLALVSDAIRLKAVPEIVGPAAIGVTLERRDRRRVTAATGPGTPA